MGNGNHPRQPICQNRRDDSSHLRPRREYLAAQSGLRAVISPGARISPSPIASGAAASGNFRILSVPEPVPRLRQAANYHGIGLEYSPSSNRKAAQKYG